MTIRVRLALLLFCGFFSSVSANAADPTLFKFGVCLSLTGEFQEAGKKALAGVKLRVDDYNADPGNPFRLEIVVRDDESLHDNAAKIVEELAAKNIPAIVGPLSTNLMLTMREAAEKHGIVLISPTVTSPRIGKNNDWAFRLLFDDSFQGVALARFIRSRLGYARAATIVNERLAYSGSVATMFDETFAKEGGEIVGRESCSWVANEDKVYDFAPLLERLAKAEPEIVLLPVNSTEVAAIIRASLKTSLKTLFCGGDTWQHENVLLSSGNNIENAFFISGVDFDSDTPAMRHYIELFDRSHDPYAKLTSVLGYDAASLLIRALDNGTDSASIKEGLYGIKDFELATGTITIDRERGSEKSAYIHRIEFGREGFVSAIVDEIKP